MFLSTFVGGACSSFCLPSLGLFFNAGLFMRFRNTKKYNKSCRFSAFWEGSRQLRDNFLWSAFPDPSWKVFRTALWPFWDAFWGLPGLLHGRSGLKTLVPGELYAGVSILGGFSVVPGSFWPCFRRLHDRFSLLLKSIWRCFRKLQGCFGRPLAASLHDPLPCNLRLPSL